MSHPGHILAIVNGNTTDNTTGRYTRRVQELSASWRDLDGEKRRTLRATMARERSRRRRMRMTADERADHDAFRASLRVLAGGPQRPE